MTFYAVHLGSGRVVVVVDSASRLELQGLGYCWLAGCSDCAYGMAFQNQLESELGAVGGLAALAHEVQRLEGGHDSALRVDEESRVFLPC